VPANFPPLREQEFAYRVWNSGTVSDGRNRVMHRIVHKDSDEATSEGDLGKSRKIKIQE
jgi:hypothetical protein